MKPVTIALLSFLVSLGVYSFIGLQLILLASVPFAAPDRITISVIASALLAIFTALYVYKYESGRPWLTQGSSA